MNKRHVSKIKNLGFLVSLIFFGIIIFLPAIFILSYFKSGTNLFSSEVLRAILASFGIAFVVSLINLIIGVPFSWFLTRSKTRLAKWLDNLLDLSLVMPTAALGFSVYLYWGSGLGLSWLFGLDDGFFSAGPMMIILLHIIFTLPYMVRSASAAILQIDGECEEAASTMGASGFTIFRTVSLPLFKDGVINGLILSFTRSISETGATMMVAGAFATAPVLVVGLKEDGRIDEAAGLSIILILSAVFLMFLAKFFMKEKSLDLRKIYLPLERKIIKLKSSLNSFLIFFFCFFIFFPTIYIIFYNFINFEPILNKEIVSSLVLSFLLAFVVMFVNLLFTVPLSYIIARNRYRIGKILDTMNEIVLLVPTSALGLSLVLFWSYFLHNNLLVLFLTHLSFSFPLLVKPVTSAFHEISTEQEEAAYSLGASSKKMFLSILLPQIKPAIIAGSIMVFMRSLSETGATLAVSKEIKTIPIIIVDLVKSGNINQAAFVCAILFVATVIFLITLKYNKLSKN